MTRSDATQQGTVIIVWHEEDGVIHKDPNTNAHEAQVWDGIIRDCLSMVRLNGPFAESCGYLKRGNNSAPWIAVESVEVKNDAGPDDGEFAYSFEDAVAVYELMETGELLGLWHSHPNGDGNPSHEDWMGHPRDGVPMFIVALDQSNPITASVNRYEETDRP